jgi:hypothetical protein
MIDLQAKREENRRKLLGLEADSTKSAVAPYTKADLVDAEVCWDIISMCVRLVSKETTSSNGRKYVRQTKELVYPDLVEQVVVGETPKRSRTNIDTMREMMQFRNKMQRFVVDDKQDSYTEYFESVLEVLDAYAQQVVMDMAEDAGFLDRVNAAREK